MSFGPPRPPFPARDYQAGPPRGGPPGHASGGMDRSPPGRPVGQFRPPPFDNAGDYGQRQRDFEAAPIRGGFAGRGAPRGRFMPYGRGSDYPAGPVVGRGPEHREPEQGRDYSEPSHVWLSSYTTDRKIPLPVPIRDAPTQKERIERLARERVSRTLFIRNIAVCFGSVGFH